MHCPRRECQRAGSACGPAHGQPLRVRCNFARNCVPKCNLGTSLQTCHTGKGAAWECAAAKHRSPTLRPASLAAREGSSGNVPVGRDPWNEAAPKPIALPASSPSCCFILPHSQGGAICNRPTKPLRAIASTPIEGERAGEPTSKDPAPPSCPFGAHSVQSHSSAIANRRSLFPRSPTWEWSYSLIRARASMVG